MKSAFKTAIAVLVISVLSGCNDFSDTPDGVIKKFGNAEVTKQSEPMTGKQWLFAAICENTGGSGNDCLTAINDGVKTKTSARFFVSKEINSHVYVRAKFDDDKPELIVPSFVQEDQRFIDMPDSFLAKARNAKKKIVIEYNHIGSNEETVVVYNASDFNKAVDLFENSKV